MAPQSLKQEERPKWFQVVGGRLLVWEGVAAIRHLRNDDTWLLKLTADGRDVRLLHVGIREETLASDGYWSCAEITARLCQYATPFMEIYYHCMAPDHAVHLFRFICEHGGAGRRIDHVTVRLDPDPLRSATPDQVDRTVGEWLRLRRALGAHQFTLVLDDNMPL